MSQISVGSGAPNDRNENPAPSDGYPSKTFGAESSAPPAVVPDAPALEPAESDAVALPSPLDPPMEAFLDAGGEQGNANSAMPDLPDLPDMPDGPNIGPSAWELQAVQGEPDPQDPAPRQALGL